MAETMEPYVVSAGISGPPAEEPDPASRSYPPQVRRWRRLGMLGGLLVATSFFLPAIKGCGGAIRPSEVVASTVMNSDHLAEALIMFLLPYLCGLVIALTFLARACGSAKAARIGGWIILGLVCVTSLHLLIEPFRGLAPNLIAIGSYILIPTPTLPYMIATHRLKRRAVLARCFFVSAGMLVWFGLWLVAAAPLGDALVGLWCSTAGAVLLTLACVGETAGLTDSGMMQTFGRLLICRIPPLPDDSMRCIGCGYSLIGLTEPRCPECGRPFTPSSTATPTAPLPKPLEGSLTA